MSFLPLSIIFLGTGLLAILYYSAVPDKAGLHKRLPNKASPASIFLTLVIGGVVWYLVSSSGGFPRISRVFMLLFSLLLFESFFLVLLRWVRSNFLAVVLSLLGAGAIFAAYLLQPSFMLLNVIIVLVTLGAATLLIRIGYLRTSILFIITILWTGYDILLTRYLLPTYTVPVESTTPNFMFPAVTVGDISLGSGDFMFLVLFALILFRNFGKLPALILVAAETVALLLTGLLLPETGFLIPYLVVMTPIFFVVYALSYFDKKRKIHPVEAEA